MNDVTKVSIDKRVMKSGGSLYVCVPNEVVELWNLKRGDEVHLEVVDGALRIEPKRSTVIHTVSEHDVEAFSQAMKGIEVRVEMDTARRSIELQFSGQNTEAVDMLVSNLWRTLPGLLSILGVSVTQQPRGEGAGEE
jgi:antitoxin component of MazEF toxin-antitoxin module